MDHSGVNLSNLVGTICFQQGIYNRIKNILSNNLWSVGRDDSGFLVFDKIFIFISLWIGTKLASFEAFGNNCFFNKTHKY